VNPNYLMGGEWRALLEMYQLFLDPFYRGVGVPSGDAKPLVLIPGFMSGDWSSAPLVQWLRRVGYRPAVTGIDLNTRCPRALAEWLGSPVERIARASGQKVVLLGHSKGGYIARTIAHARPDVVSHVIAIGSPYRDALDANWYVRSMVEVTKAWNRVLHQSDRTELECYGPRCPCGWGQQVQQPLPNGVGYSAIYTCTDGVARWTHCPDPDGKQNFEVSGSHAGLPVNVEVYRCLATILHSIPVEPLPPPSPHV
jgi:triacylglycerol lipase